MIIHSKSDDVVFLPLSSWNEFKPNIEEICKVFNTLSLNSSPRFCRSIIHNQRKLDGFEDIGTDVFAINKILFKSVFSVSIVDRNYPLIEGLEKWLNYQTCYALCLPVPKPIGIFSIKKDENWVYNGIMMEYLSPDDGWKELSPNDEDIYEIIDVVAKKNVLHRDMHFHNVLKNSSTGEMKLIDLDAVYFNVEEDFARTQMTTHAKEHENRFICSISL